MKNILASAFSLLSFTAAFAQVTISSPYDYGQTVIKIIITSPSITIADSTALEVNYGGGEFQKVTSVKGLAKELSQGYTNADRFKKTRNFRVAVYQKNKPVVYSNEVEVYYQPQFTYSETGLPSVTNVKAVLVEKDGSRYLHFTWTAVPGAMGYRIFIEDGGSMIWEASIGDQGYFYKNSCDYLLQTTEERTYVFGVGAVEGPNDNNDVPKLVNKVTIKVPAAY